MPLHAKHCLSGKRVPHFAHAPGADCAAGAETAIHLAAKQIIEARRTFYFPELVASVEEIDAMSVTHRLSKLLSEAGRRDLAQVQVEAEVSSIRPDLLVDVDGFGQVAIEIAVTHFTELPKKGVFASLGLAAIEVDLSAIRDASFAVLEKLLCDACEKSVWLWHPELASAERELRKDLHPTLARAQEQHEASRKEWRERRAQEHADFRRQALETYQQSQRWKADYEAAEAAQRQKDEAARQRAARFKAAPEAEKQATLLRWLQSEELPPALRFESPRKVAFGMHDPHVWQTTFFAGMIHKRAAKGVFLLTIPTACEWMWQRFDSPLTRRDRDELALREYLHALAAKGGLIAKPQGFFHTGVADLDSFNELLELHRHHDVDPMELARRVAWVDVNEWPEFNQPTVMAMVMSRAPVLTGPWYQLSRIQDGAREVTPLQACQWGASLGLDEATTLEFLIRAGYVRFIKEPPAPPSPLLAS